MDGADRIYVADAGNARIVRMNDMKGAGWMTLGNTGPHRFMVPVGIYADGAGRIYVADFARVVRVNDITGTGWTTFNTPGITRAIFVR